MSDTDLLRRAATKARETATAATPGAWEPSVDSFFVAPMDADGRGQALAYTLGADINGELLPGDANRDHIALWHPGVALAVAAMLACASNMEAEDRQTVAGEQCGWCGNDHLTEISQALIGAAAKED